MTSSQAGRELLATFVHISDIHIGEIDPVTGDAAISRRAARIHSNFPWLDGLLGHHGRALHELDDFIAALRDEEPGLRLIVTGDLTRVGGSGELQLAKTFIEQEIDLSPPHGNDVGLRLGAQRLIIPGNHDQWAGANGPHRAWPSQFGGAYAHAVPRIEPHSLPNGQEISFICIDSDADVRPQSLKRVRAIGDFQTQLQTVQTKLPTKKAGEFRVMLIHHSWFQKRQILRMTGASKAALEQLLVEKEVSAILCGHSHAPLLDSFTAKGPLGRSTVYELRSGSSGQHDSVPLTWRTLLRRRPVRKWEPNSLIVHRVYADPDAVRWRAELHARCPRGFEHLPIWDREFALL